MREEEEEPLSPMARVFQSRGIDYCAVTMIGFKTKIKPAVVLDALKHNVYKHPRFSSKLVHTYAYLHILEPAVDVQYRHVYYIASMVIFEILKAIYNLVKL